VRQGALTINARTMHIEAGQVRWCLQGFSFGTAGPSFRIHQRRGKCQCLGKRAGGCRGVTVSAREKGFDACFITVSWVAHDHSPQLFEVGSAYKTVLRP
jgi:hypothetical protein